jgi:hypothetical protein
VTGFESQPTTLHYGEREKPSHRRAWAPEFTATEGIGAGPSRRFPLLAEIAIKRGFVWVFHGHDVTTGGQLVLYVFAVDRSGDTPAKILGGTQGALVVD